MRSLDKKWWVIIIAALVLVLVVGAFFILKNKAYQTYLAGVEAHRSLDVDTAVERYQNVVAYPKLMGSFVEDAEIKLGETQAFQDASELRADGHYAEAQKAFKTFVEDYPASVFFEKSRTALIHVPFEWAGKCTQNEDYECAVDVYDGIVQDENVPDENVEEAKTLLFDVYTTWAANESQAGDFTSCEMLLVDLLSWTDTNDPSRAKEVKAILTETYLDWGDLLYEEQDYETALEKYNLSLAQDVSRYAHRAEENIGAVYLDWGDELVQAGDSSGAGEKYGALILGYSETDAYGEIPGQAAEPLLLFGEESLAAGEFADAEEIYTFADSLLEDGQDEMKAAAEYGIGQAYFGQSEYLKAVTAFDQALELTELESLKEDIQASRESAIEGIGQLDNYLGTSIIYAVSNHILGYKDDEPTCYTADGIKTCLTEEEMQMASLIVGQEEDEKRIMLFIEGNGEKNYPLPDDIEATRPGHFRYIGIVKETQRQVESCKYSKTGFRAVSHYLVRAQRIYKVYIYDTRTGLVVDIGTFYGSDPMGCPRSYTFHAVTEYVTGGKPDMDEVVNWLRGFAE